MKRSLPVFLRGGLSLVVVGLAALLWPALAAYATPFTFVATLTGANEIPVNTSPGTGQAVVVLDPAAHTLQITVTFSGLTSDVVAAHIHCCLPSPLAATNVGVATTVQAFPGFPLGVTAGTYSSQVFALTQPLIYNLAFVTAQGGLTQAEAALVAGIENAETYLNIHTSNFPGGEIRGYLQPAVDTDNDGVPDDKDECPNSDLGHTVVIDGCNSGVSNTLFPTGCTIADRIAECAEDARNHGQFVSCVSHLTNDLKNAGTITGQQKDAIESCAGRADIP
jgi:hypothetical protein